MKVRATQTGYYNLERRREGDEFVLSPIEGKNHKGEKVVFTPEQQFAPSWMEKVEKPAAKAAAPAPSESPKSKSGQPSGAAAVI